MVLASFSWGARIKPTILIHGIMFIATCQRERETKGKGCPLQNGQWWGYFTVKGIASDWKGDGNSGEGFLTEERGRSRNGKGKLSQCVVTMK
jgi:hypothetical protein